MQLLRWHPPSNSISCQTKGQVVRSKEEVLAKSKSQDWPQALAQLTRTCIRTIHLEDLGWVLRNKFQIELQEAIYTL